MAEERTVILKVELDPSKTVAGLKDIDDSLGKVDDSVEELDNDVKKITVEDKFAKINKQVKSGELDFRQLRKTIQDYQGIALEAGRTSPIGKQALQEAANLKDRLTDLDNEVKRLAHDGANLQAAMQLGQGVLAGFTAFKGVTAALGIENENLMKTMTQLQGASSALMAVEQLRASLEKESFLRQKLAVVWTKAQAAATIGLAAAQKVLNFVMSLNPIGLIITAITVLIGLFIAFKDQIFGAIKAFIDFNLTILKFFGLIEDTEGDLEDAREKRAKAETERHKKRVWQLKKELEAQEAIIEAIEKRKTVNEELTNIELIQAKARGAGEQELFGIQKAANDQRLLMAREELFAKNKLIKINNDLAVAEMDRSQQLIIAHLKEQGWSDERIKNLEEHHVEKRRQYLADADAQIEQNERAFDTISAQNELFEFKEAERIAKAADDKRKKRAKEAKKISDQAEKNAKSLSDKAAAERKKEADREQSDLEKAADDIFNRRQAAQQRLDQMLRDENADDFQLKINQLEDQHAIEMDLLSDNIEEEAALKIQLERALQEELAAIRKEAAETDDIVRKEELQAEVDRAIELAGVALGFLGEINAIANEIGERRKQKIQEERDADLSSLEKQKNAEISQENLSALEKAKIEHRFAMQSFKIKKDSAEAEDVIARKQFNRNKALRLSEIAINTAAAVVQALAAFPPPASFVFAGATAAIGIAQSALVASTQFKGSSSSIQAPTFTAPTDADGSGSGDRTNQGGGIQDDTITDLDDLNIPTKVIVSQVDINETQEEMANVQDVATI